MLSVAGFTHWNQPLSILTHPVIADGSALASVGVGAVVAAMAITMFSVNGYDSAINFSEETRGAASNIGKAVVIAALTGIVLELVPFIAGLFGAQDLHDLPVQRDTPDRPGRQVWGTTAADIIIIGALFAVLNAILAITLQFARILWSSARDRAWPDPVNGALGRVHPTFQSPWVATLITGSVATVLCFASRPGHDRDLHRGADHRALRPHRGRRAGQPGPRPRTPTAHPGCHCGRVPPVLVLIGVVIALTQQTVTRHLSSSSILFVVGWPTTSVYLHRAQHDRWVPHTVSRGRCRAGRDRSSDRGRGRARDLGFPVGVMQPPAPQRHHRRRRGPRRPRDRVAATTT